MESVAAFEKKIHDLLNHNEKLHENNRQFHEYNIQLITDNTKLLADNAKLLADNAQLHAEITEEHIYNKGLLESNTQLNIDNTALHADNKKFIADNQQLYEENMNLKAYFQHQPQRSMNIPNVRKQHVPATASAGSAASAESTILPATMVATAASSAKRYVSTLDNQNPLNEEEFNREHALWCSPEKPDEILPTFPTTATAATAATAATIEITTRHYKRKYDEDQHEDQHEPQNNTKIIRLFNLKSKHFIKTKRFAQLCVCHFTKSGSCKLPNCFYSHTLENLTICTFGTKCKNAACPYYLHCETQRNLDFIRNLELFKAAQARIY